MPEPSQNADPAVTAEQSESWQTVDTIDSAATEESNTCEKSTDPVGQLAVPSYSGADPEYVIIGGKKVELKRYTLNELLNQSAAKLREKIFRERGIIVPEFDPAPWADFCPPSPTVESLPEPQPESASQGIVAQVWANERAKKFRRSSLLSV